MRFRAVYGMGTQIITGEKSSGKWGKNKQKSERTFKTIAKLKKLSVIILNIPIKRQSLSKLLRKEDPAICLEETHFKYKNTGLKGWKKYTI